LLDPEFLGSPSRIWAKLPPLSADLLFHIQQFLAPQLRCALFPQPVLVFTGSSQFLALAATTTAVVYSDSARTDLNGLGKGRRWKCKKGRRDHEYKSAHH